MARPGDRFAIIEAPYCSPLCLTIPCHPGKPVETAKKNVAVLATCQALLFTNNSTAIALNGLAGYALAADKALATLPVTAWVIGGARSSLPASLFLKRLGRGSRVSRGGL